MQITIHVNGLTFKTKKTDETAKYAKDQIYSCIADTNKIEFETENGEFVVFGEEAVRSAVFVFSD